MPKLIFKFPDKTEIKYALYPDRLETTIGRTEDNKIALPHDSISKNHAVIRRVKGGYELVDRDSKNGIRGNNVSYLKTQLKQDVTYEIGDVILTCLFSPLEIVNLAKESMEL